MDTSYIRRQLELAREFLEKRGQTPALDAIRRALDGCSHVDAEMDWLRSQSDRQTSPLEALDIVVVAFGEALARIQKLEGGEPRGQS